MVTSMEKPYVVGMDIGGTNTVFGIVDQRGNVFTESVANTLPRWSTIPNTVLVPPISIPTT